MGMVHRYDGHGHGLAQDCGSRVQKQMYGSLRHSVHPYSPDRNSPHNLRTDNLLQRLRTMVFSCLSGHRSSFDDLYAYRQAPFKELSLLFPTLCLHREFYSVRCDKCSTDFRLGKVADDVECLEIVAEFVVFSYRNGKEKAIVFSAV